MVIIYDTHFLILPFRTESPRVGVANASRVHAEGRVGVVACRRGDTGRREVDHVLVSIVEEAGQAVFTQPYERAGRHGLRRVPDGLADVEVAIVDEPFAALRDAPPHAVVGHRDYGSVRVARPADGAVLAVVLTRPFAGRRDEVRLVAVEVERRKLEHAAAHDVRVLVEFVRGIRAVRPELTRPEAVADVVVAVGELRACHDVRCENQFAAQVVPVAFVVLRHPSARHVVGVGLIGIDRGCQATESEMKDFAQSLYSVNKHFLPAAAVPAPNATLAYKTR